MNQPNNTDELTGLDITGLVRAALKNWILVAVVAASVLVVTAYWVSGKTRIYQAQMTLRIEPRPLRPLGRDVDTPGDSYSSYWTDQEFYNTQHKIIVSHRITSEVARVLALHRDPRFFAQLPADAPLPPTEGDPPTVEAAGNALQGRLQVTPIRDSRLVQVQVLDADPARAQRILHTLADVYIDETLASSIENIGSASEWLGTQLTKLKDELESTELALHEFKKEKRLLSVSLDDQSNLLAAEMAQLNKSLTEARAEREKRASRLAQLQKVDPDDPSELPVTELLESSTLKELRQRYVSARSTVESAKSGGRGENHPLVLEARAELELSREALLEEISNIREASRRDLLAIEQEIGGLSGLYEEAKREAFDLNLLAIEYSRLARARENTERLHTLVLERSKEAELSSQMRFNSVSVLDAPQLPKGPVSPRVGLTLGVGAFLGLALGFLIALLRERMDRRIKSVEDIEIELGITCLGSIPKIVDQQSTAGAARARRRRPGQPSQAPPELWVHQNPTSDAAEAVRTLRTNLAFLSPEKPFRRILVTSASPTDGKTTVAASLATSVAESGKSVLMIDADLRRPRLSGVMGQDKAGVGVSTVILDPESLAQAVRKTSVPKLDLLATGPLPPNPAELLHSGNFGLLLNKAQELYDLVIIDSPPLMAVADGAILSTQVDATLLVIRDMSTRKDHAKRALRALRDVNAKIAGAVHNGVSRQTRGYYGYYGYYGRGDDSASKGR